MDTKVSISTEFLESLVKLPKTIQEKVINFFSKFIENPGSPGIKLKKIDVVNGKQLYSVRISDDYRGIGYKDSQSNIFHLLWVEHRKDVYNIVDRMKGIKIGGASVMNKKPYSILGLTRDQSTNLFSSTSNKELLSIGVEEHLLPLVRGLKNIEALQMIKELLPDVVYSNLELKAYKICVKDIISVYDSYRDDLIDIIMTKVLLPGLEHPGLDQDVKDSIKNTIDRLKSKKSVFSVIDFFYDALMSNDGKYIREKLNENGLLAFEDIELEVRDFISKM
jgi:mRNA-degrading endonuclease RelE of RelBE toxin-antitoxin system